MVTFTFLMSYISESIGRTAWPLSGVTVIFLPIYIRGYIISKDQRSTYKIYAASRRLGTDKRHERGLECGSSQSQCLPSAQCIFRGGRCPLVFIHEQLIAEAGKRTFSQRRERDATRGKLQRKFGKIIFITCRSRFPQPSVSQTLLGDLVAGLRTVI